VTYSSDCVSLGFIARFGKICPEMSSIFSMIFLSLISSPSFLLFLGKYPHGYRSLGLQSPSDNYNIVKDVVDEMKLFSSIYPSRHPSMDGIIQ
jgi:hypothetical protein